MSAPRRLLAGLLLIAAAGCAHTNRPQTVPYPGGSIYVDDGGKSGVPVVFIHGSGGSSAVWQAQLDHLRANGRRAIAVDLPGFGRSSAPANGDYSLGAMASAIDAVVGRLGVKRFVIVGHSYGGAVVAKYAATHAEKVAGVVYVDAAAVAPPVTPEQLAQIVAAIRANKMQIVQMMFAPLLQSSTQPVKQAVLEGAEKTNVETFVGAIQSLTSYDAKALISGYTGPRLAIVATELETPMAMQRQFPEIEAVRLSGAGHWLMLDKPAEVNAAIDQFFTKVK